MFNAVPECIVAAGKLSSAKTAFVYKVKVGLLILECLSDLRKNQKVNIMVFAHDTYDEVINH